MAKYRVRPGFRHGMGKVYGEGDIVEMSPFEAKGFLDKLEPVEETASNGADTWVSYENPTNSPSVVLPEVEVDAETDADDGESASNEVESPDSVSGTVLVVNPEKRGRGRPRKVQEQAEA